MSKNDGKTEKPTARRLKDARDEGQIPRSQEIATATMLLTALLVGFTVSGPAWNVMKEQMITLLTLDIAGGDVRELVTSAAVRIFLVVVGPFAVACALAGIVSNVVQVGAKLRTKAAKPKLSRISPKAGLERLKPSASLWELARTALKLGLVAAVVSSPLQSWRDEVLEGWTFRGGLATTGEILSTILMRVALVAALVAVADYIYNRRKIMRNLRMTKDEMRQELKDQMGDPMVRGRRMQRARELSRNRMLASVALADVVITNPTHLAVALKYVASEPAPRVVAKGADRAAVKIRAEARRNGVLVTENKPLAQALFRRVKPGDYVPQALFEAVAVVLATVYRRRARAAAPAPAAAMGGLR